jgi:hypothetical protein
MQDGRGNHNRRGFVPENDVESEGMLTIREGENPSFRIHSYVFGAEIQLK